MTTPSTLTDRYVTATLRRLPTRQRPDIERELRTSIADDVDDRLSAGAEPAAAEVAALTALGDPARLAAGFADRPLHLIGPALYLDYTRLLTALLAVVVPAVAAGVALLRTGQGDTAGTVISASFGAAITAGVHVAVWTTVIFAFIERLPAARRPAATRWTPASLPEPPSRRVRYGELVAETVILVLFATLILISPRFSIETDASGEPIGVLSPWLWDSGVVYLFLALATAMLGFSFAKYYARPSLPLILTGSLVEVSGSVLLIWLAANDKLLNPAFVEAVGWSADATRWINTGLIVIALGSILHTVTEAIKRARV